MAQQILGTVGSDSLFGSLVEDLIIGFAGNDVMLGADGNDGIAGNSGIDVIAGNKGDDTMEGGQDGDFILAGQDKDIARGDAGNDSIAGNEGEDSLFGNDGDDVVYGGKANDFIWGGRGNDSLFGDIGNDVIFGDRGADSISGGDGNDLFVLTKGGGGATIEDADVISDFKTGDRLAVAPGLTLAEINLQFVPSQNNASVGDMVIRDLGDRTGSFLAVIKGVAPGAITRNSFVDEIVPLASPPVTPPTDGGGGGTPKPPANNTLQALSASFNIAEDTLLNNQLQVNNPQNKVLTYTLEGTPTLGSATLDPKTGILTYIPNPNVSGLETLSFKVNDGTADSAPATLRINVFSAEDIPTAIAQNIPAAKNQPLPIALVGSDGDGDPLTATVTTLPLNGKLFQTTDGITPEAAITAVGTKVTNPQGLVIFQPNPGTLGEVTFGYTVSDGKADSAPATVAVNLQESIGSNNTTIDLNGSSAPGQGFSTSFTPSGAAISLVDPANLTLADPDKTATQDVILSSATVQITNLQNGADELLDASLIGNITKTYNAATGTLVLTGAASIDLYQAALRTVTYRNTNPTPNPSTRIINFTVSDATGTSSPVFSSVAYTPVGVTDSVIMTTGMAGTTWTLPASAFLANDIGTSLSITSITAIPANLGGFGATANGSLPVTGVTLTAPGGLGVTGSFTYNLQNANNLTATATVNLSTIGSGGGADNVTGGNGPDILDGKDENDIIDGGPGSDLLNGGRGTDSLTGGLGSDIFTYGRFDGSLALDANSTDLLTEITTDRRHDVILDFVPGVDKIGVSIAGMAPNTLNSPDDILLPVQTGVAVDTDILPNGAFLFAYELSGSTYIIYDENSNNINGNDSRVWAKLQGVTGLGSLNANDFVFI
jgi:Bacterial Ig domain/RTX calcium-binding nonapeptide repeat (4 copies)